MEESDTEIQQLARCHSIVLSIAAQSSEYFVLVTKLPCALTRRALAVCIRSVRSWFLIMLMHDEKQQYNINGHHIRPLYTNVTC